MPMRFRAPFWLKALGLSAFLSCHLCTPLSASVLTAELRHHSETSSRNLIDESLYYRSEESQGLYLAGRFQQNTSDLESLAYAGGWAFAPLSFISLEARLAHGGHLNEGTSLTHLLGTLTLRLPTWISPFASAGWYKRWALLQNMTLIPSFRSSYTEHDFALALGCNVRWNEQFATDFLLSTFEEIDVFNLNNPFAKLTLVFTPKNSSLSWYFFGRYKVLLGFGRLDSFTAGGGISLRL